MWLQEEGTAEIGAGSSLSSVLRFALGTSEGNVMSPPPLLLCICVMAFEKSGMKYPGHWNG